MAFSHCWFVVDYQPTVKLAAILVSLFHFPWYPTYVGRLVHLYNAIALQWVIIESMVEKINQFGGGGSRARALTHSCGNRVGFQLLNFPSTHLRVARGVIQYWILNQHQNRQQYQK